MSICMWDCLATGRQGMGKKLCMMYCKNLSQLLGYAGGSNPIFSMFGGHEDE